jgi:PPK2 family polyphosphate:nucleotide phosphotransferase
MKKHIDLNLFRVRPGRKVDLKKDHPPDWKPRGALKNLDADDLKAQAASFLKDELEDLSKAQELLFASNSWSVLCVFQAIDAAGKDSMIKHVMSGVNPSGCQVFTFKKPSEEDLDHDFLWRTAKCLPERGRIGIFNRSYYEEVLVVRVHPEFVAKQRLPEGDRGKAFWRERFESINAFERHLVRNGTLVLKFFLNVSKDEQKKRFLERLTKPDKHWKFSVFDLDERARWKEYREAFEEMLEHTSTDHAPWYVIPSDHKYIARAIVAEAITTAIENLHLEFPKLSKEEKAELAAARKRLENE